MQERGTLLGRKFTEGRRYSSWPERAVVIAVFCSALFFFEDIDPSFGVESEVLTVILLIFMIPLVSDFIFRVISSLTGVR